MENLEPATDVREQYAKFMDELRLGDKETNEESERLKITEGSVTGLPYVDDSWNDRWNDRLNDSWNDKR